MQRFIVGRHKSASGIDTFYTGARLELRGVTLTLVDADDYTRTFMAQAGHEVGPRLPSPLDDLDFDKKAPANAPPAGWCVFSGKNDLGWLLRVYVCTSVWIALERNDQIKPPRIDAPAVSVPPLKAGGLETRTAHRDSQRRCWARRPCRVVSSSFWPTATR